MFKELKEKRLDLVLSFNAGIIVAYLSFIFSWFGYEHIQSQARFANSAELTISSIVYMGLIGVLTGMIARNVAIFLEKIVWLWFFSFGFAIVTALLFSSVNFILPMWLLFVVFSVSGLLSYGVKVFIKKS